MPVPAVPRRAAPPRKKAYKSPSATQLSEVPAPTAVPEAIEEAPDATPTVELTAEPTSELEPESVAPPSVTSHESPEQVSVPSSEEVLVIGDVQDDEVGKSAEIDASEVGPVDEHEEGYVSADEPQPVPEREDWDEEEGVAAKLSQMGAVNPLEGPPPVPFREFIPSPTASHSSIPAAVPGKEPLDVEDEVDVDLEEVGESHLPQEPEAKKEAREEADERGSRAGEF